ncbi:hypothetical protein ACFX13_003542 [Malus domestica]
MDGAMPIIRRGDFAEVLNPRIGPCYAPPCGGVGCEVRAILGQEVAHNGGGGRVPQNCEEESPRAVRIETGIFSKIPPKIFPHILKHLQL